MFKLERYKLASLLLMFFAMTILCTSLFLMIGVEVSFWNLVLALLVSGLLFFRMYGDSKATLIYTSTVIVVIGLLIMYSNVTFDNTWDGSAYHKQAIGFLKHGWNPIYQDNITFNELSNNIKYPRENPMVWAEAYPKAIWYFSASVYDLTGNIESGKLYHLLFAIITYLFFSEYLMSHKFKKYQYILISFVIACNPILMAQFNSYYLDSVVGCVLMLILLFFVQTFEHRDNFQTWINLFFLMVIACNLKFSVAVNIVTFSIVYLIYYYYIHKKNIKKVMIRFGVFLGAAVGSLCVVGFSPFITNLIRYGNMFYGFLGKYQFIGRENTQKVFGIQNLSDPVMFCLSLIGRMSHGEYSEIGELIKIPFTFRWEELTLYYIVDPRIGGFGIFFSGIFIVSLVVIVWKRKELFRQFPEYKYSYIIIPIIFVISFVEMSFLPSSYNARYIGFFYIVIFMALYMLFGLYNRNQKKVLLYTGIFVSVMSLLNISPYILTVQKHIDRSVDTKAAFQYLQEESREGKDIYVSFYVDDFTGINYNLKDLKINYKYVPVENIDSSFKTTYSNWIYYKVEE